MYLKDSFFTNVEIDLDGTDQVNLVGRTPTEIFFVYGAVTYIGGVTPQNQPLIVPGNEDNLYLNLFMGSNQRVQRLRLSDLVFDDESGQKFLPIVVPGSVDFDQSFIENPTLLNNITVMLGFWYLPKGPDTMDMAERWSEESYSIFSDYIRK